MAGAERVFGLLAVAEPDGVPNPRAAREVDSSNAPAVSFQSVSFGYAPNKPVLHDVSFDVQVGKTIALVGATGAGKTTVLSLLQRLYDPDAGTIFVHGRDIRTLDRDALRRPFAVVPQDAYLFPGDVLENIAIGDRTPDLDRAEHCARSVGLEGLLA